MAYILDDFIDDVTDAIKKVARQSTVVRDLTDDIADERKLQDLMDTIIEDIFDDADKDDCLMDGRGRVNENVIQEAVGAVLGVIANKQLADREWDELSDKVYDAFMDGVEIYKDAVDRLEDNDYGNKRSRRDRTVRSGSRRDRGGSRDNDRESRRGSRTSKRDRPKRASRTGVPARNERTDPTKPARPYGNRTRRDRDSEEESTTTSRNDIAAALEDSGITTVAKLMSDMDVEGITIRELIDYAEHRADFARYLKNKPAFEDYLHNLNKPIIGGLGKDSFTGVVLQDDAVLVNGEVKHVEHYMEHELNENARRANMQRYGMRKPAPAEMPAGVANAVIEIDKHKYNFTDAGRFECQRSLDFVDYTDLTVDITRKLSPKGDYVIAKMFRELSAVFTREDMNAVFIEQDDGYVAPKSFFQLHDFLVDGSKHEMSDAAKRFVAQLEEAATHTFNQCLHMADAGMVIESMFDDFPDAMEIISAKDRFVRETFTTQLETAYRSMYQFVLTDAEVEEGSYTVSIKREITVFYSNNPIMAMARMSNENYNTLHPKHFPELYRMIESVVEHRGDGGDVIMVDAYRNHYVINVRETGASAPIIIREI